MAREYSARLATMRASSITLAHIAISERMRWAACSGVVDVARELPVDELKWRRPFGVIYRNEAYLSPAARRLIEVLRAVTRRVGRDQ